ncbi:hypothetical protein MJI69_29295, partial [Salmonella enterica subsp. enterica serovar Anatum]|nr:hypothetical protein [Salmonella enterica subsp. enterica serovar Anatum]
ASLWPLAKLVLLVHFAIIFFALVVLGIVARLCGLSIWILIRIDHSGARKNLANAKLGVRLDEASKLSLIFNSVDIKADDPGGLT